MWINEKEYDKLQKRLDRLECFYLDIEQMNGVLTGHTASYNMLRDTALEMYRFIDYLNPRVAEKYKEKIENADKVAWHNSIAKDCCIGGYDELFDLEI